MGCAIGGHGHPRGCARPLSSAVGAHPEALGVTEQPLVPHQDGDKKPGGDIL